MVPWLKEKAAVDDENVISSATTAATRGNKEGKRATRGRGRHDEGT
jgi:hypothetical protein